MASERTIRELVDDIVALCREEEDDSKREALFLNLIVTMVENKGFDRGSESEIGERARRRLEGLGLLKRRAW